VNDRDEPISSNPVPIWRIGAAVVVLAGLALFGGVLGRVYIRNLQFERFLRDTAPASDEVLKRTMLDKGRSLGLDIAPDHLQIRHDAENGHTDVRYVVRISFALYTVDLHFSSSIAAARQ
jgi:uncharacterized protein YneF (UPF0154 family)